MLVGREKEVDLLNNAYNDNHSHFIAVYGRRRVGKTFLITETFKDKIIFHHAGLANGNLKDQLIAFKSSLSISNFYVRKNFKNWLEAFDALKMLIINSNNERKVVFIDELSWMDTPKSNFITALENFWNGWASSRSDVILIVCASATSWMINKIIHNKGGLYNRLTEQINLMPFTLRECEEFIKYNSLIFDRNQILQYYMVFGGVPFYYNFIVKSKSISQNIDDILFSENAPLKDEFKYLFSSIFKNSSVYLKIIESLSTKNIGLTREEILEETKLINSGDVTTKLEELESCGFIRKYYCFGTKKKNALYQIIDNFTLFYFRFLSNHHSDLHFWSNQINTPRINTWLGLAFEKVCLLHVEQIKQKLGISGVLTNNYSWFTKANADAGINGSQIDLLIVRADRVINLCEIKYANGEYLITKDVDFDIKNKISDFQLVTKCKFTIHPTLITTYGLKENSYSLNISNVITLDDLFY